MRHRTVYLFAGFSIPSLVFLALESSLCAKLLTKKSYTEVPRSVFPFKAQYSIPRNATSIFGAVDQFVKNLITKRRSHLPVGFVK